MRGQDRKIKYLVKYDRFVASFKGWRTNQGCLAEPTTLPDSHEAITLHQCFSTCMSCHKFESRSH